MQALSLKASKTNKNKQKLLPKPQKLLMPKPLNFKQLQKKWNDKLKASGFEDAEDNNGNLKVWHNHLYTREAAPVKLKAKEEYYRVAGFFLHDYEFETSKERKIWELHSEGKAFRTIGKKVREPKSEVHRVVTRLKQEMLKMYARQSDDQ